MDFFFLKKNTILWFSLVEELFFFLCSMRAPKARNPKNPNFTNGLLEPSFYQIRPVYMLISVQGQALHGQPILKWMTC